MSYFPPTGSVVAFQSDPTKLVGTVSVVGNVASSVIGLTPVGLNVGGSPVTTSNPVPVQPPASGSLPVIVVGSVATVTPNQSVSGTVGVSVIGRPGVILFDNTGADLDLRQENENWNAADHGILIFGRDVDSVPNKYRALRTNANGDIAVNLCDIADNNPDIGNGISSVGTLRVTIASDSTGKIATVTSIVGTPSISGTVNVGNFPTSQNVSGSVISFQAGTQITSLVSTVPSSVIVGASIFGLPPVNVTNTNLNVGGSVVAFQGAGWSGSVASHVRSGSIIAVLGGNTSIAATYAEDAGHTSGQAGLFVLGVRNDAVASFVSANLDYAPIGVDSAGRSITKPFAAEEARIEGYNSVVSTSVTTLIAAAGTGLRNYITDIQIANTGASATLVTFRSGGGTSILGYTIAPASGGSNITLQTPMRTLANETFDFQASTSTSVLYGTVKGFKAP